MPTVDDFWDRYRDMVQLPLDQREGHVDEVAALAREVGDEEAIFWAASAQFTVYGHSAEPDVARQFGPFARMLASLDAQPEWFGQNHRHVVLWDFKSLVGVGLTDPRVSRAQIEDLAATMADRYARFGGGPAALGLIRYRIARDLEGLEPAQEPFEQWRRIPRDEFSDCEGCEPETVCYHLVETGRYDEAAEYARRAHDYAGNCTEQPRGLLRIGVEPLLLVGASAEAVDAHLKSVRDCRDRVGEVANMAGHVEVLARAGHPLRALELIEHRQGFPVGSLHSRLDWQLACALTYRALEAAGHDVPVRLVDGETSLSQARHRAEAEVSRIVALYDARNGNDHKSREAAQLLDSGPLPYLPLPAAGRARGWELLQPPVVAAHTPTEWLDQYREANRAGRVLDANRILAAWPQWDGDVTDPAELSAAAELDAAAAHTIALRSSDIDTVERLTARAESRAEASGNPFTRAVVRMDLERGMPETAESLRSWFADTKRLADELVGDERARLLIRLLEHCPSQEAYDEVVEAGVALPTDSPTCCAIRAESLLRRGFVAGDAACVAEGLELARRQAPSYLVKGLVTAAVFDEQGERHDRAAEQIDEAFRIALAEEQGASDWLRVVNAAARSSQGAVSRSHIDEAVEVLDRLTAAREWGMARFGARLVAQMLLREGRRLEAIDLLERAIEFPHATASPRAGMQVAEGTINLHQMAAETCFALGETARAGHHAREVLELSGRFDGVPVAMLRRLVADAALEIHDDDEALRNYRAGFDAAIPEMVPSTAAACVRAGAGIVYRLDGPERALAELEQAASRAGDLGEADAAEWLTAIIEDRRADVLRAQERYRDASACRHAAAERLIRADYPEAAAQVLAESAVDLEDSDASPEAIFREALDYARLHAPGAVGGVAASYCAWLARHDRSDEADALWESVGGGR